MQIFVCRRKPLLPVTSIEATKPKLSALAGITKMLQHAARIMKISAILLLGACLHLHAAGFGQKITLSEKEAPIERIFEKIQKQTNYKFLYSDQLFQNNPKVTISVTNASVQQVLDRCLRDKNLEYEINDYTIIVRPKLKTKDTKSQEATISGPIDVSGKVTDNEGHPLAGANVKIKGAATGTITDNEGHFTLNNIDENSILEISFVGHETQTITVRGKSMFNIVLNKKLSLLDETVVIAYGTTTRRLSTGNVSSVKASDIEKHPVSNLLQALPGRVPGVEVVQENGLPGGSFKIRIRGRNSINGGNDPLFIVDGVPIVPGVAGMALGILGSNPSAFYYLNSSDIERIDVLKDAEATSIYGSRAANGAILITTKKGKAGTTKLDVNIQSGWGKIRQRVDYLNREQYLGMRREAFANDGVVPDQYNAPDLLVWDTTRSTDWQKVLFGGTAHFNNAQLSISGGNNVMQYLVGGNYNKTTSVFPGNFSDEKVGGHFSISGNSPDQKLKTMLSGSYTADNNQLPAFDFTSNTNLAPNAPALYNPDGSLNWANSTWDNPFSSLYKPFRSRVNNLIGNFLLSYHIIPGLEVKTTVGYNNLQGNSYAALPLISYDPAYWSFIPRYSFFGKSSNISWIIEPQVNYAKNIGKGELTILAGGSIQHSRSQTENLTAGGFISDDIMENLRAATSLTGNNSIIQYKYNALFGRIGYDWAHKYLINLSARRDGSSRFGPGNQFANFGAISAGWIFSNENWIQTKLPFVTYGKLRCSYGTSGNDQIGDYQYLDRYRFADYSYQNTRGLISQGAFNPFYAWETTKKLEFGLETGFWKNRLLFTASYYRNRSSNQLISYPLPSITGSGAPLTNLPALVQNSGWEWELNTAIIKTIHFTWTSNINLTVNRNKLIKYPDLGNSSYATSIIGKPLGFAGLYHLIGADPATGQYIFADKNGDPTFTPNYSTDRSVFISPFPTYFGGFQNSISYKGFQIDVLFQFVKQRGTDYLYGFMPGNFYGGNQPATVLQRWQKPGDNATIQRFSQSFDLYNSYNDAYYNSDQRYTDASFIRLKNVSVSWTLPEKLIKRIRLQNARLYVQAQNLLTISHYKGLDPETQSTTSLPPMQVVMLGIQVTL